MKVLLLTKKTDWSKKAQEHLKRHKIESTIIEGDVGDPYPDIRWKGDYMVSFLSPWIIKEEDLNKAAVRINFHPAPPEYPGIGCYNFAIYNNDRTYGVTCHHMKSKVDSGDIIEVSRFPLYETDLVFDLKERSMTSMFELYLKIVDMIASGKRLPESKETWQRKPYTRKDLQKLTAIEYGMPKEEVIKRLKATYFPGARDPPRINVGSLSFVMEEPNPEALEEIRK